MILAVRTAAVAIVAASACLASAVPAVADMTRVNDGAGDVWEGRIAEDGEFSLHRTDVRRNVDVRNVKIAHSARKLKFWVRFVETRSSQDLTGIDFMLRTNERRLQSVSMVMDRETDTFLMRRNGRDVRCRGLRAEMQYKQDEFELDIPRRCLGRPTWVKVGAMTSKIDMAAVEDAFDSSDEVEYLSIYADLIGNRGFRGPTWTKRLYRG